MVVTEIWAAVALGGRWSFTVCKPGLGIVTRVGVGGLKGGREGKGGAEPSSTGGRRKEEGAGYGGRGLDSEGAQRVFVSERFSRNGFIFFLKQTMQGGGF